MLRLLITILCLYSFPAFSQTLLYKNPCPAPSQSDTTYLAGIDAIRTALKSGKTITMSMSYLESGQIMEFFVQFSAIKASPNYASGLILMRPAITNEAQATVGPMSVGSADTLGNYRYGTVGGSVGSYSCYENAWWSHN